MCSYNLQCGSNNIKSCLYIHALRITHHQDVNSLIISCLSINEHVNWYFLFYDETVIFAKDLLWFKELTQQTVRCAF